MTNKENDNRVIAENTTDTGTSRVRETKDGKVYLDVYWGDVRDEKEHDRFSICTNDGIGEPTGHGFNHEKWDDEGKDLRND